MAIEIEDPLKMTVIAAPATIVPALMLFDPADSKLKIGTTGALTDYDALTGDYDAQVGDYDAWGTTNAWDWVVTR